MLKKIVIIKQILRPIVIIIRKKIFEFKLSFKIKRVKRKNKKCIFLLATPCHGNLGDQAIVYAQYIFLANIGLEEQLIEITNTEYLLYKNIIKKKISINDTIIIDGGGNLGTLWPHEDDKISEIINDYNNNKIIIFPQTCFYTNDIEGRQKLEKNKMIYYKHKNLTISLRDRYSYEFVCKNFSSVKSLYVPDIVLYISNISHNRERNGVILCFRKDLEKVMPDNEIKKIKFYLNLKGVPFAETDTIIYKTVTKKNRNIELRRKWKEFSNAGLIITDRLHGMIFAAITGTPCIAVDNKSKKVSGVYSWISSLDYIRVIEDMSMITNDIFDLYKCNSKFDNSIIMKHFNKIALELKEDSKHETT